MKEVIEIMGKKFKKLDDINSSLSHLRLLIQSKVKVNECNSEIERLTKEKEDIEKEIEESLNVLKS